MKKSIKQLRKSIELMGVDTSDLTDEEIIKLEQTFRKSIKKMGYTSNELTQAAITIGRYSLI